MQQTEVYKLNLIETTDPFSPAPLNENAEKTEAALGALDGRVTMLEAKYFVFGTYTGNGTSQIITLDFTPKAVLVHNRSIQYDAALTVEGRPVIGWDVNALEIVENGFQVKKDSQHGGRSVNDNGQIYNYIAFG